MLDKSVPFIDVVMCRAAGVFLPDVPLPPGFAFSFYQPGDELAWAEIETSVGEFARETEALLRFQKHYQPYGDEPERRCVFLETDSGEKIGAAIAWWGYHGQRRDPWLHWLALKPEWQGRGLGRALVARVTRLMQELEGDRPLYLHTQTWSHHAIRIYRSLGWRITAEARGKWQNTRHQEALDLLRSLPGWEE